VQARYFPDLVSSLQIDADDLRALAVQAGLGAALLPCYLGDSTPGIHRANGVEPLPLGDLWLLMRPDSRGAMKVRLLTVYLQELFEAHSARLSGSSVTHEAES
jgi:DNA-binding transcriptional LysR family regulator